MSYIKLKCFNPSQHLQQQRGLSLIELMIAMTLGLFLIWGVTQSFLTSRQVYQMQQGLSRIQENTRMAQEFIAYDLRNAGDYGCAAGDSFMTGAADIRNQIGCGAAGPPVVGTSGINMIQAVNSVDDEFQYAVYGFNNVVDGNLAIGANAQGTLDPPPRAGTDVLMVHTALEIGTLDQSIPNPYVAFTLVSPVASLQLPNPGGAGGVTQALFEKDRIAVSDCLSTKIFSLGTAPYNNSAPLVDIGEAVIPLSGNYCTASSFQKGSSIRKLSTVYYYVALNLRGTFSLYRAVGNASIVGVANELLEGVDDMQLDFGVDNAGDADGIIDIYKTADNVTAAEWNGWDWIDEPTAADHIDYNLVRAVRYSLLMNAGDANLLADKQQVVFNGVTLIGGVPAPGTAGDKGLRQVVSSTVGIRSRAR